MHKISSDLGSNFHLSDSVNKQEQILRQTLFYSDLRNCLQSFYYHSPPPPPPPLSLSIPSPPHYHYQPVSYHCPLCFQTAWTLQAEGQTGQWTLLASSCGPHLQLKQKGEVWAQRQTGRTSPLRVSTSFRGRKHAENQLYFMPSNTPLSNHSNSICLSFTKSKDWYGRMCSS